MQRNSKQTLIICRRTPGQLNMSHETFSNRDWEWKSITARKFTCSECFLRTPLTSHNNNLFLRDINSERQSKASHQLKLWRGKIVKKNFHPFWSDYEKDLNEFDPWFFIFSISHITIDFIPIQTNRTTLDCDIYNDHAL